MKQRYLIVLATLVFLLGLSINCSAQINQELKDKSRYANKEDVVGVWKMSHQTIRRDISTNSLFFANFQVLQFLEDGFVKNIASNEEMNMQELNMFLSTMPKKTTFRFVDDGALVIERSEKDSDDIIIKIVIEDFIEPLRDNSALLKKGDLILTYLDPRKQIYMRRYFKRLIL